MIAKSLSTSEKFAALYTVAGDLAEFCQSIYPLMVAHSDDSGRQQGDTFTVKHVVLPISPRSIAEFDLALGWLDDVGLIHRYSVDGRKYIEIRDFAPHQPGLKNRDNSKIPAMPRDAVECRDLPSEEKRTEQKGTEQKKRSSPEPLRDSTPPLLEFPVVGTQGTSWGLTRTLVEAWAQAYPQLDVLSECRKALVWLEAHPERRKTPRGMPGFLVNWFNRSTDSGRGAAAPTRDAARGATPERAAWRDECRSLQHDPPCGSSEHHQIRLVVAERGCQHPGVCRSLGECRSRRDKVPA